MTRSQLLTLLASHPDKLAAATAIQLVGEVWKDTRGMIPKRSAVIKAACKVTGADYETIRVLNRKHEFVRARHLFFYYFQTHYPEIYSLKELAKYMHRDHTSVIHGRDTIKGLLHIKDIIVKHQLAALEELLIDEDYKLPDPSVPAPKKPVLVKYLYDKKTEERYEDLLALNKALGTSAYTPLPALKKRFGMFRFEWIETPLQK